MAFYSPVKRFKSAALSANEKIIVLNVFNALRYENPSCSVENIVERCANMTGIGKTTIYKLRKEEATTGAVKEPASSSGRPKMMLSENDRYLIRRKVHSFYFNKEIPTLNKIFTAVNEDEDLPKLSRAHLWKILKELNFSWEKTSRKAMLLDKLDIVCWRRRYLREIRRYREENRHIFYLDETWVNEGHTVTKTWQDNNVKSRHQAVQEGWSTGFHPPTGKGRRLIIVHIGSVNGFVDRGSLVFQSKRTGDYHEDMNAEVFEEYFDQMLSLLPENSVIVMDNASYHSRHLENLPTSSWKKTTLLNG